MGLYGLVGGLQSLQRVGFLSTSEHEGVEESGVSAGVAAASNKEYCWFCWSVR